jgi:hypothetical protein
MNYYLIKKNYDKILIKPLEIHQYDVILANDISFYY